MSSALQQPNGDPMRRRHRRFWGLAYRCYRVVLVAAVICFALVGALVTPPYVVLLFAPLCGVTVAGTVGLLHPAFPEARSARRAAMFAGTGATLFVPALAGIEQFGAAGMAVTMALVVTGWIVVGGLVMELSDEATDEQAEPVLDEEDLQAFVRVLPIAMLLDEWRATGEHVRTGAAPARRARAVVVRRLLLEEFTRRDPAGVARWLSDGDEESPEQYIRGDSDATT